MMPESVIDMLFPRFRVLKSRQPLAMEVTPKSVIAENSRFPYFPSRSRFSILGQCSAIDASPSSSIPSQWAISKLVNPIHRDATDSMHAFDISVHPRRLKLTIDA